MKKIIATITVLLVLASCKKVADGEYIISGTIKGVKSGKVFLSKANENGMGMTNIDTVKITDGKFEIKGKTNEPAMHLIQVDKYNGSVPFILEEGEINVSVDKDSIFKSKIGGTYNNDEFNSFNENRIKIQKGLQKKIMDFQTKNMVKMNEAQKNNDTVTMNSLRKQYQGLQKEMTDYTFGYPKNHSKSFISALIVQGMVNNPMFKLEEVEKDYNALDESLKKTAIGKKIKESINAVKDQEKTMANAVNLKVGSQAPQFEGKSPEGKLVTLKECMGKVTLIDFWASWCMPCRAENPNVVKLYEEFHAKGLNIVGVSLDENLTDWKQAIAKDKITWNQVSNLKKWKDPIATQYGVMQIPSTFLLDASGNIVAKDLKGEALKAKVAELLAK